MVFSMSETKVPTDFKQVRSANRGGRFKGSVKSERARELLRTRTSGYSLNAYHNYVLHQLLSEHGLSSYAEALRRLVEAEGKRRGISQDKFLEREDAEQYIAGVKT